jgi:tight adherence protein B
MTDINPAALLLVAGILVLGLLFGIAALVRGGAGRQLRARVRGLSGQGAAGPAVTLPSIRVTGSRQAPLVGAALRLLRFNPDIPQERIIPWPLLALAGLAAMLLVTTRLWDAAGLPLALAAGLLAGVQVARMAFGWQHARYCDAVFRQMPDALGLMVRGIRAGLPVAEALRSVAREMPAPTREEYARVVGEMAIGRPVEAALLKLHERTGLTEYAFLSVTLGLQAQTGGSLAETLENLADMVRKRVAMANRAKALAAEARMQAGLLVVLPFIAALAMSFIQPFYIETFTQNPTGRTMAVIGLVMMLFGLLTIRWLIRRAGMD